MKLRFTVAQTELYNKIQNYADSSVNANLLKGFGNINKVLGETIAKVPVINTLQIDEVLIETGDKIKNYSYKKANEGIEKLIENQSIYVVPFVENIKEIMVFGEVDLNKRFLDFMSQQEIILHFFNYLIYFSATSNCQVNHPFAT